MGKKKKPITEARKVKILEEAYHDIEEIVDFIAIANKQPLNAIKISDYFLKLLTESDALHLPTKECEQLATEDRIYRQAVCSSWLIIYKITDKKVIILGIIHSSRKPSRIKRLKRR
ncbi:MAG TPA: type II toxin-antitoxin system RelE/ParE family toxin [Chitinophagaceae bacterium]|nr:type II toxin-antitoxin system RelE/ParE family toxin [Chitinophagaceae bacterium]